MLCLGVTTLFCVDTDVQKTLNKYFLNENIIYVKKWMAYYSCIHKYLGNFHGFSTD